MFGYSKLLARDFHREQIGRSSVNFMEYLVRQRHCGVQTEPHAKRKRGVISNAGAIVEHSAATMVVLLPASVVLVAPATIAASFCVI